MQDTKSIISCTLSVCSRCHLKSLCLALVMTLMILEYVTWPGRIHGLQRRSLYIASNLWCQDQNWRWWKLGRMGLFHHHHSLFEDVWVQEASCLSVVTQQGAPQVFPTVRHCSSWNSSSSDLGSISNPLNLWPTQGFICQVQLPILSEISQIWCGSNHLETMSGISSVRRYGDFLSQVSRVHVGGMSDYLWDVYVRFVLKFWLLADWALWAVAVQPVRDTCSSQNQYINA